VADVGFNDVILGKNNSFNLIIEINMKRFSFLLFVLLISVASCKPPFPAEPPMQETKLRLPAPFLNFCEKFHEGGAKKNLDLTIEVYGYTGVNTTPTLMWDNVVTITNDSADAYSLFNLELPSTGAFLVEVAILGQSTCFSCCSMAGPVVPLPCSPLEITGRVRFRGVSARYDADNPPNEIEIIPILNNCYNCGC